MLALLEGVNPNPSKRDCWEWVISKKGLFIPKSLYLELDGFREGSFPIDDIWIPGIPSKVSFMWNAFLDKIFTINHLQSRVWNLANRCVMCLREESMDHLFCSLCCEVHGLVLLFLPS